MTTDIISSAEFSDLTHAGQCLDIYLNNTSEIYERYTLPAIQGVKSAIRANVGEEYVINNAIIEAVPAVLAAASLVRKYDHLKPTRNDLEQVKRNYCAYIIECAQHEINNTVNA